MSDRNETGHRQHSSLQFLLSSLKNELMDRKGGVGDSVLFSVYLDYSELFRDDFRPFHPLR